MANAEDYGDLPGSKLLRSFNTGLPVTFTGAFSSTGANNDKMSVISGQGATATLTAAQSGSFVLFDRAAGIIYTLPTPAVGLYFDFLVTTTITSNNAKVITDVGTTFLQGTLIENVTTTSTPFYGNGTSHIAVLQNGTTTGGILGSWFRAICVSSTIWNISGLLQASGTVATAFSTT